MESDEDQVQVDCFFVPEELLQRIFYDENEEAETRNAAAHTLAIDRDLKRKVPEGQFETNGFITVTNNTLTKRKGDSSQLPQSANHSTISIYNAHNTRNLPGGHEFTFYTDEPGYDGPVQADPAVLFSGLRMVCSFFKDIFNYAPFDGKGTEISATVHYDENYGNAVWKGRYKRLVVGEGDGHITTKFSSSLDVIAHQVTHGIIAATSDLSDKNQSGALNEHLADVFGLMCKQHYYWVKVGNDSEMLAWCIGEKAIIESTTSGIVKVEPKPGTLDQNYTFPEKNDKKRPGYVRSFKDPGSAVPWQPCHMKDYVNEGYGRGHINSGILNFAFYHAVAVDPVSEWPWQGVGQVWFRAMCDRQLGRHCTFSQFAAATIKHAQDMDPKLVKPIADAWKLVGISY